MLILNLIASGLAPFLVGYLTDHLFGDPTAVGRSIALVGTASPVAAAVIFCGMPAFRRAAGLVENAGPRAGPLPDPPRPPATADQRPG